MVRQLGFTHKKNCPLQRSLQQDLWLSCHGLVTDSKNVVRPWVITALRSFHCVCVSSFTSNDLFLLGFCILRHVLLSSYNRKNLGLCCISEKRVSFEVCSSRSHDCPIFTKKCRYQVSTRTAMSGSCYDSTDYQHRLSGIPCPKTLCQEVPSKLYVSVLLTRSATGVRRVSRSYPQKAIWSIGVPVWRDLHHFFGTNSLVQAEPPLCRTPCLASLCTRFVRHLRQKWSSIQQI